MTYQNIHEGVHAAAALVGVAVPPETRTPEPAPAAVKGDPVKAFVALARKITGNKPFRVFDDWCEMGYCVIASLTTDDAERLAALKAQHDVVAAKYTPEHLSVMSEMMAVAADALAAGGDDYLGRVCGEMGALDGGVGQFFTPFDASRLVVSLTAPDVPAIIRRDGHFRAADPAAGSGGLLVAMADHAVAQGAELGDLFFEGVELVPATYHMLFVQMTLRGLAGRAVCGNSLTGEVKEHAYTPAARAFVRKHGIRAAATTMVLK